MFLTTKPLHLIISAFYRIAYKLHHKLFLRPQPQLRVPVVIVGSYLAGGAGKTPFTIWLAKHLQEQGKKIAILCHSSAWDEINLLKTQLPNAKVIATKNRYATAKEIQDKFSIIICDDGFEDSRFTGATRICLDWHEPPQSIRPIPQPKTRPRRKRNHPPRLLRCKLSRHALFNRVPNKLHPRNSADSYSRLRSWRPQTLYRRRSHIRKQIRNHHRKNNYPPRPRQAIFTNHRSRTFKKQRYRHLRKRRVQTSAGAPHPPQNPHYNSKNNRFKRNPKYYPQDKQQVR